MATVGEKIRKARAEAEPPMSRERLARRIGVSLRTLQRWENDEHTGGVSAAVLKAIAKETRKPLEFFIDGVAA